MNIDEFTVLEPLLGGAAIGAAAVIMLLFNGRIAGISGIVGGLLTRSGDAGWRLSFTLGLVAGGVLLAVVWPEAFPASPSRPLTATAIAGVLVGFGTRMGGGCTSGHGVCGMSRLSSRSILATLTFIATGTITVFVFNHVLRS